MGNHVQIRTDAISVERIERALDSVAKAIDLAGAAGSIYLPIYARLERELQALRNDQSTLASVQERLNRLAVR